MKRPDLRGHGGPTTARPIPRQDSNTFLANIFFCLIFVVHFVKSVSSSVRPSVRPRPS